MINSLLTFGAKSVKPEILEQTLTVRKAIVDEIEESCVNKTIKHSTYQALLIAPRGSGKTHLIKVLYHRLKNNTEISNKSVIAYMSEDEVGIANFTDLMVSILRSFIRYGEVGSEILETQISEASLITNTNKREIFVKDILKNFAEKRIIILLIENFDKILKALAPAGQGSLRDFIHLYNNLSIIATSQNLIANLQDSKSPFYNFFNISQLNKLDYEGTVKFLESIAKMEENQNLVNEINKPESKGKLRAIYELTEGNHRLLVTFYSFLKAEYKTDLSGIFAKVMNDLKPYYEQFINVLPAQQQKIIKYLSLNRRAIGGKEIATACFIEQKVLSKQTSLLFEKGMIDKNKSGKDTFYELKEPLMRICFEISENPNGISKLFVDFLSTYYDSQIIREKYLKFKYGARFQMEDIKCKYENEAMMYSMALSETERSTISLAHLDLEKVSCQEELDNKINTLDAITQKQKNLHEDYFVNGNNLIDNKQYNEAIEYYKKAIEINPKYNYTYNNIGFAFNSLKQYKKAIENYKKAIEINSKYYFAYFNMGIAFVNLKQYKKAIDNYKKAIEINPEFDSAYNNMGIAFGYLKQYKKTIENCKKAIEINPELDSAYYNMGNAFYNLTQYEKAIVYYKKSIEINPELDSAYYNMGNAFKNLKQYEKAIENYKKAIEINPKLDSVLFNIGFAYNYLNQYKKAIEYYKKAIEINPKDDGAFNNLGLVLLKLNKIDDAIESFKKGIKINPKNNYTNYSLLGAYIRINDQNKSKELVTSLINKVEEELLSQFLFEDVFYNLFRYGSQAFVNSYFEFLLMLLLKENKIEQLWKTIPDSLFDILINIENYDTERLANIEKSLGILLSNYEESIIPLKMFSVGIAFLKNNEKNAIYQLSKEERKLFKEAVLDKRE